MIRKLTISTVLALVGALTLAAGAQADFGIKAFGGSLTGPGGEPMLLAGGHPDVMTAISFNTALDEHGFQAPDGNPKDVEVTLPVGLIGNPTATPKCTQPELLGGGFVAECAPEAQVGVASITTYFFGGFVSKLPLYNMVPPPGSPAQFGFNINGVLVFLRPQLVNDGEYTLEADIANISQGLALGDSSVTLWGIPADPSHDMERVQKGGFFPVAEPHPSTAEPRPLMTNPTSCSGHSLVTAARADSWQQPGLFDSAAFETDPEGNPLLIEGCDSLPFEISLAAQPTTAEAESPTGLDVTLTMPQNQEPEAPTQSALRSAVVTLPEGMAVNPSSAGGLGSCSPAQIDLEGEEPATCPQSSKIGSVEIATPLLASPLQGGVYLAKQGENKFGSLLAIYLAVADPATGIVLKLPGRVETDPATGRLTASFENNPQVPFERLRVKFFGGPRASLMTPAGCGTYTIAGQFSPWSGTAPVSSADSFQVTSGPNGSPCPSGRFSPELTAGTINPVAGSYSPFVLEISRIDGMQRLGNVDLTLPKGLLAKLAGIPYCPDAALGAVPSAEGTGAAQLAAPSCSEASRVGTVSVGAGAGSNPFFVNTGKAYLAGPYKGAPLSLAFVTPALAGPFDLGNVLVRTALRVDPESAQVQAVSDPLPTILHGIPLDLRMVRVDLDRDGFTLNPTSCAKKEVAGTIGSAEGATAAVSELFQADACNALGFAPKLSLRVEGATKRGDYPALTATLKARKGDADIAKVSVALPHSEFLAQEHIETICTRVQFKADACPKGSIYGFAEATTPLLDEPLKGPVYLRSSSNPLPDLVASLDGQIDIDLAGRIDSVGGGIRTVFKTVPDAPVTSFTLRMKGGKKGLLVNSQNLCKGANRATVKTNGHNGKAHSFNPIVGNSCGSKRD
jgi:hypothetical protein